MKQIICEHCGKFITETESTSQGKIAAEININNLGIAKMPILYGITDGFHFLCSKTCWNNWLTEHTTQEQRDSGQKEFDEIKEKMTSDKFISGLQTTLDKIQKICTNLKNK